MRSLRKIVALKQTRLLKVSGIIETQAVGGPAHQNKFLNAALKLETFLAPLALLKDLKRIERQLGRRKGIRWGPRTIDVDILFYGDRTIDTKKLQVPHPRISEREFVLRPLLEIL